MTSDDTVNINKGKELSLMNKYHTGNKLRYKKDFEV